MSIKVHYLLSHSNCLPENFDEPSEKQGERFHQHMKTTEKRNLVDVTFTRCQLLLDPLMHHWSQESHKRKSYIREVCM